MEIELTRKLPLVFDDDPLEHILSGNKDYHGPTPADCFLHIKMHMKRVRQAHQDNNTYALLQELTNIASAKIPLTLHVCNEILQIVEAIVRDVPLPIIDNEFKELTPLLEEIWRFAQAQRNIPLQLEAGWRLHRCYEHQREFNSAREILRELIQLAQETGAHAKEALYNNNLAFEYLLEGKWQDAMPYFDAAARLSHKLNDKFEYANSRANYLTCVFAEKPATELSGCEDELQELYDTLSESAGWKARKPLVLLAKIYESRNDLAEAIRYVEAAVTASEPYKLQWTVMDREYLAGLKARQAVK